MEIIQGHFYFVSDSFFQKINDPYLKINYETTKRPHYFPFIDKNTGLLWLVPCSSKVKKFERIIEQKKVNHKPTDTIKIVKIFGKKTVLLFQDMFPTTEKYIFDEYIKGGKSVRVSNPNDIASLEKAAAKTIRMIHKGVKFTPTQPDALRIEKMMIDELNDK